MSGDLVYFEVDDLEAAVARVRELGGEAGEPQSTEVGHYSVCTDDQGVEFGIFAVD
jgi:predicted enzyme related to lactoylglutathione lyase